MANEEEYPGNIKRQLAKIFEITFRETVPSETDEEPLVAACGGKFGDYQCRGSIQKVKGKNTAFKSPNSVGQAIANNLPQSEMVESCSVAAPGFVNVVLSKAWSAKSIQKMLIDGIQTWAPKSPIKRAVVDFSSPNIAKEMHVGHLRSTIIGTHWPVYLSFLMSKFLEGTMSVIGVHR